MYVATQELPVFPIGEVNSLTLERVETIAKEPDPSGLHKAVTPLGWSVLEYQNARRECRHVERLIP